MDLKKLETIQDIMPPTSGVRVMRHVNLDELESLAFNEAGVFQILPAVTWNQFSQNHISQFCIKHGMYCIPTVELIHWLKARVKGKRALEVGAGSGVVGRAVGIRMTDNFQQDIPKYKFLYDQMKQSTVTYGKDVLNYDAVAAVKRFRPHIAIGCWVTHKFNPKYPDCGGNEIGLREHQILKHVEEYIVIGNNAVHNKKLIMEVPHETFNPGWLISRGFHADQNRIYIWKGRKK